MATAVTQPTHRGNDAVVVVVVRAAAGVLLSRSQLASSPVARLNKE